MWCDGIAEESFAGVRIAEDSAGSRMKWIKDAAGSQMLRQ